MVILTSPPCSMLMSVPMACSLFPQHMSIATSQLEKSAQDKIQAKMSTLPDRVYFNKGLWMKHLFKFVNSWTFWTLNYELSEL